MAILTHSQILRGLNLVGELAMRIGGTYLPANNALGDEMNDEGNVGGKNL